jgi:hypothetical protein
VVGAAQPAFWAQRWAALSGHPLAASQRLPLLTDMELHLQFPVGQLPDQRARPDEHIVGSSGDVRVPIGTIVGITARFSATHATGARLDVVRDQTSAAPTSPQATIEGNRFVGSFVVTSGGSWRAVIITDEGEVLDPVAHRIVVEVDPPPQVTLLQPATDRVVQLDDIVDISFEAKDDHGLGAARITVKRQGAPQPFVQEVGSLRGKADARQSRLRIRDTGAGSGDKLAVVVEVADDGVEGQIGRSATRVLEVYSPAKHHQQMTALLEQVLEGAVDLLAGQLEHRPQDSGEEAARREVLAALEQSDGHATSWLQLVAAAAEGLAKDPLANPATRQALLNVRSSQERLWQQHQRARSSLKPITVAGWKRLSETSAAVINKLEQDTLFLDDLLQRERLDEVRELMEEAKRTQQDLVALLRQYKETGDPQAKAALLNQLRSLKNKLADIMARVSSLSHEVSDEHLNEEALQSDQMIDATDDIEKMIADGKLEDAEQALQALVNKTNELAKGIQDAAAEIGSDEFGPVRAQLQQLQDGLKAITDGESQALHDTEQMLQRASEELERQQRDQVQQALQQAKKRAEAAKTSLRQMARRDVPAHAQEEYDEASARTDELLRALAAGDVEDALRAAQLGAEAAEVAQDALERNGRRDFGGRASQATADRMERAAKELKAASALLRDAMPDPGDALSGADRKRLQRSAQGQSQLAESAQQLEKLLDGIRQQAPLASDQQAAGLREAKEAMQRAAKQLRSGDLRGARASQAQAMQRLKGMQEGQSGSSGSGRGMPTPMGAREQSGDGDGNSKDDVTIPDGNGFRVPDAFRRDILDAMREQAPGDWRDEVRRYYEDLIR